MNILISGGSGLLGSALTQSFLADGHKVSSSHAARAGGTNTVKWDAKTTNGWGHLINEMDVVIHLAGKSLSTGPGLPPGKNVFP
jgi:NAD dependent epimerase/dehydratase family enzyme